MLKLRLDWSALQRVYVFRSTTLGFSKLCVLLPSNASPSFVFVYSWGSWFKHNHGFRRQCFTLVELICLFTPPHIHTYMSPSLSTISFQFEWLSGVSTYNTTLEYAPTQHKLTPLFMRRRGFLHHASMASSCDWEWDILDMKASRIMALQLALDLQAHWLTPVQLNRSQPWMSPSSSHAGPLALARTQTDSLMGHQTKLPVWLTSIQGHEWQIIVSPLHPMLLSSHFNSEQLRVNMRCYLVQAWIHS